MIRGAVCLFLLLASSAFTQPLDPGQKEWGVWVGYSPVTVNLIGLANDRQLAMAAGRFGYVFARSGPVTFEYTADVLPVMVVLQPWWGRTYLHPPPFAGSSSGRIPVYGFGAAPVGFKFNFGRRTLRPFLGITGGIVHTTESVPITGPDTASTNFMFDVGGGVQYATRSAHLFFAGYKLHHISDAYRTRQNPGLDSNVFFVGYSWLR